MGTRRSRVDHKKRQILLTFTGGKCWFCGEREGETIDHMIPLSRGGTDRYGNVVPACGNCNHKKGDMTVGEYRYMIARNNHRAKKPKLDRDVYIKTYKFWGETKGLDPMIPLRCLRWKGTFASINDSNWIQRLWHCFLPPIPISDTLTSYDILIVRITRLRRWRKRSFRTGMKWLRQMMMFII